MGLVENEKLLHMKRLFICLYLVLGVSIIHSQSFLRLVYPDISFDPASENIFFIPIASLPTPDDGVVLLGNDIKIGHLCKFDANGEIEWAKNMQLEVDDNENPESLFILGALLCNDGGILVSSQVNQNNEAFLLVCRFDSEGNLLWSNKLVDDYIPEVAMHEVNGGYIILFHELRLYPETDKTILFYLGEDGTFQYGKRIAFPDWFGLSSLNPRNTALIGTDLYFWQHAIETSWGPNPNNTTCIISKYNLNTEEASHIMLSQPQATNSGGNQAMYIIHDMKLDNEGHFYIVNGYGPDAFLSKYQTDGTPLWSIEMDIVGNIFLTEAEVIVNGYDLESENPMSILYVDKENGEWRKKQRYKDIIPYLDIGYSHQNTLTSVGVSSNVDFIASNGYDIFPVVLGKADDDGVLSACESFETCEEGWSLAEALAFVPISLNDVEDFNENDWAPFFLITEDQPFINEPYCIPFVLDADFPLPGPVCPYDTVVVYSEIEHFLPTTSEWSADSALPPTSSLDTAAFHFSEAGLYEIEHIISMEGCMDTVIKTIEISAGPIFELGADTSICIGDSLLIESGLAANQASFLWQDSTSESSMLATIEGQYKLEATNDLGCTYRDSLYLSFVENPVFSLGEDIQLCDGGLVNIEPDYAPLQAIFEWNNGEDKQQISPTSSGTYILTITDATTHCEATDSIEVLFANPPVFDFRTSEEDFCPGLGLLIEALDYNPIPLSFYWPDGSLGNHFEVPEAGTYKLIASDGACEDSLLIEIPLGLCLVDIYIPNAFSPNDDGRNDFFRPLGPNIETLDLTIYNRWGGMIYQGSGDNSQWDGEKGGEPLAAGIYIYQLEYLNKLSLKKEKVSGEVMLVR